MEKGFRLLAILIYLFGEITFCAPFLHLFVLLLGLRLLPLLLQYGLLVVFQLCGRCIGKHRFQFHAFAMHQFGCIFIIGFQGGIVPFVLPGGF